MMIKAESQLVEKIAYLCCTIIACYIMEGIFSIDLLDRPLSAIQCVFYVGIVCSIAYITYEDPNSSKNLLQRPVLRKMRSSSSFDQRQRLPIATIAVIMHLVSSLIRVVDMTYGDGREGYKGDMSSATYQSISNFAVCDMMLVCFVLLFALCFCETEHHKLILWGQAGILFVSQIMLAGWQGEQMATDMTMAGSIGTFVFVLIAIIGAL
jgi:magnesium-transporting ATPase (P-type)